MKDKTIYAKTPTFKTIGLDQIDIDAIAYLQLGKGQGEPVTAKLNYNMGGMDGDRFTEKYIYAVLLRAYQLGLKTQKEFDRDGIMPKLYLRCRFKGLAYILEIKMDERGNIKPKNPSREILITESIKGKEKVSKYTVKQIFAVAKTTNIFNFNDFNYENVGVQFKGPPVYESDNERKKRLKRDKRIGINVIGKAKNLPGNYRETVRPVIFILSNETNIAQPVKMFRGQVIPDGVKLTYGYPTWSAEDAIEDIRQRPTKLLAIQLEHGEDHIKPGEVFKMSLENKYPIGDASVSHAIMYHRYGQMELTKMTVEYNWKFRHSTQVSFTVPAKAKIVLKLYLAKKRQILPGLLIGHIAEKVAPQKIKIKFGRFQQLAQQEELVAINEDEKAPHER